MQVKLNDEVEKEAALLSKSASIADLEIFGCFDRPKSPERHCGKSVWLLITIDDSQVLGEKPVVHAFAAENAARMAMNADIQEEANAYGLSMDDVEFSKDECFAQTKNGRFSWEIAEVPIMQE